MNILVVPTMDHLGRMPHFLDVQRWNQIRSSADIDTDVAADAALAACNAAFCTVAIASKGQSVINGLNWSERRYIDECLRLCERACC